MESKELKDSQDEIVEDYSHVKCKILRKFLENNQLATVFDLEEHPMKFKNYYFKNTLSFTILL